MIVVNYLFYHHAFSVRQRFDSCGFISMYFYLERTLSFYNTYHCTVYCEYETCSICYELHKNTFSSGIMILWYILAS